MKPIYDFEAAAPPLLNERILREAAARKKAERQTLILTLAALLCQIAALLLGFAAIGWHPLLAAVCFGYVLVSATGGSIIAIVYSKKGGHHSWQQLLY